MSSSMIVRGWKDEDYLSSLSDVERSVLPGNPAGAIELREEELSQIGGFNITFDSFLCGGTISFLVCISALWNCIR